MVFKLTSIKLSNTPFYNSVYAIIEWVGLENASKICYHFFVG